MIICHDIELVFIHVPKCAGTAIRRVFEHESIPGSCVTLFDFEYNHILKRHVDLAHLPLMDFRHYSQWKYLRKYHTVACIRHPYARIASACREYYRQFSRESQIQMLHEPPSVEQLISYLRSLPAAFEAHDLRYTHAFPITWFTHYGAKPMVDSLLRIDHLEEDLIDLSDQCKLPAQLRNALLNSVGNSKPRKPSPSLQSLQSNSDLQATVNLLHQEDFSTYGFKANAATFSDQDLNDRIQACLQTTASHAIPHTSLCPSLRWYWGRNSNIVRPAMQPTRRRSPK